MIVLDKLELILSGIVVLFCVLRLIGEKPWKKNDDLGEPEDDE